MPQFSSVQSLSHVQLFATSWTAARQTFLSITNSQSLLKLMSIESVMPSNHLILCRPLLLPPSVFPNIRVFSNESVRHIRWPKYWSFNFSISSSNEFLDWFPLGWTGWISLQSKGLSRVFSNITVQSRDFIVPVKFSRSVVSDSLRCHGLHHGRLPCPSPTSGVYSNSCPLSRWGYPTISSSVIPFSSCLQSFPSIRVFSNESVRHIRWLKYWSFSFSISPSSEYSGLISFRIDWFDLLAVQGILNIWWCYYSGR